MTPVYEFPYAKSIASFMAEGHGIVYFSFSREAPQYLDAILGSLYGFCESF